MPDTPASQGEREAARECLAKQYDYSLPNRAAHIRAGTSDHKAVDAMLSFAERRMPSEDRVDTERLHELLASATERPWRVRDDVTSRANWISAANDTADICEIGEGWPIALMPEAEANAALIVGAINALPFLLDALNARPVASTLDAATVEACARVCLQVSGLIGAGAGSSIDSALCEAARQIRALSPDRVNETGESERVGEGKDG
jgi:hypothetical protein